MAITEAFPGPSAVVDSLELRKNLAGLIVRDTSGNPRAGVFPRHTNALVSSTATMSVNVAAFEAALVRTGPLFIQNDGTVAVTIATAPVSNSRIDVVWVRQPENGYNGFADGSNTPLISVTAGTAAASPVKPAIPAGALELATVLVPAGATATNSGGVVITQTHQYTAATGGVVLLRNQTEETAWTPADGSQAYRLDLNQFRLRGATAWGPRNLVEGVGNCDYGAALPTADTDVPGSSVTFTLAVPTKVVLSYGGMMQINTGTNAYLNLNIDGATAATAQATGPNVTNTTFAIGGGHVVTLAAGTHTIKLTVAGGTAGSCAFKDGFWTAVGA